MSYGTGLLILTYAEQREVVVGVTYNAKTDKDTTYYIMGSSPVITLTDSTANLINYLALVRGQNVRVTEYITDHVLPGYYARLYHRYHGEG